jgi:hypothetical protein
MMKRSRKPLIGSLASRATQAARETGVADEIMENLTRINPDARSACIAARA